MKIHQGIAMLAVVGFVGLTSGIAQAGPGCSGSKSTQAGSSACGAKGSSMKAGGCGSMKASGGACTGQSSAACSSMSAADCEKMLRTYYRTHGWLGIGPDCCVGMQTNQTITRVAVGSPAEKAGFKTGDVLTSVNGINFAPETQPAIQSLMTKGMKIGDTVRYTAMREGQIVTLNATLAKIDDTELKAMIAEHTAMPHRTTDKAENNR